MVPKPLDRPGDDLVGNVFIGIPLILRRIEKAKAGEVGLVAEPVDMRHRLTGTARIGADRGVQHGEADIVIFKRPLVEISPREIDDPHPISLADGLERPFPNARPVRVEHEPKFREGVPDLAVLLFDG